MDNTQLDPQALALTKAIRQNESGGDFTLKGQSGEYGAYQYTKPTWEKDAAEFLGDPNADITNPQNQNKVAYSRIKKLKDEGYNVGQIASIWNSGNPDAFQQGHRGVNKYGVQYDVPAYAQKVAQTYQELKGQSQPQPSVDYTGQSGDAIAQARQEKIAAGEPVSQNPNKVEPTFFGNIAREIIKLPVKAGLTVARGLGLGGLLGAKGAYTTGLGFKSDYLGNVEDYLSQVEEKSGKLAEKVNTGEISKGRAILGAVGAAAEPTIDLASFVPIGGAASGISKAIGQEAAQAGGKTLLQKGAPLLSSAAQGAGFGAGFETSSQLASGEKIKPGNIFGAAAAGGLLQPAAELGIPAAIRGIKKTPFKPLIQVLGGKEPSPVDLEKYKGEVAQHYKDAIGFTRPRLRKEATQKSLGKATDLEALIEEDALPSIGENGKWNVEDAIAKIDDKNEFFSVAEELHANNEPAWFNLSEVQRDAERAINQNLDGTARSRAKQRLASEIEAVSSDAEKITNDKGETLVKSDVMSRLRRLGNSMVPWERNATTEGNKFRQSVGFALGNSVRNNVEKYGTYPAYRNFNKMWGEILSAKQFLENLRDTAPRKKGGLSGEIAKKMASLGVGFQTGGIWGAIASNLGLDTISRLTSDPALYTIFRRELLRDYGKYTARPEAAKELLDQIIAKQMDIVSGKTPLLPESKTIFAGPKSSQSEVIATSGDIPPKDFEEAKLMKQMQQKAESNIVSREPIDATNELVTYKSGEQKVQPIKKKGLLETAKENLLNPQKRQSGFVEAFKNEGDLTTKILKDLEGKTTVSKQYILDATNRPELKQVERDLIRDVLATMDNGGDELTKEAKKYKSAEEFVEFNKETSGLFNEKVLPGYEHKYSTYRLKDFLGELAPKQYKDIGDINITLVEPNNNKYGIGGKFPSYTNAAFVIPKNGNFPFIVINKELKGTQLKKAIIEEVEHALTYRKNPRFVESASNLSPEEYIINKAEIAAKVNSEKRLKYIDSKIKSQLTDIWKKAQQNDTINVKEFADKVKAELLPLKRVNKSIDFGDGEVGGTITNYENIVLPDEIRGNIKDYSENIYQSPIKTSAGEVHFGMLSDAKQNYFGHTRIEDMADNKTRRVIEVQSDLYQKGNLEKETENYLRNDYDTRITENPEVNDWWKKTFGKYASMEHPSQVIYTLKEKNPELLSKLESGAKNKFSKLQQYNDPTAHFRMIREEIKKAAQDGKTKLQFPTGETAMKIEGLGDNTNWRRQSTYATNNYHKLTTDDLKVGANVNDGNSDWIITDVLGDGKFKAVPKESYEFYTKPSKSSVFSETNQRALDGLKEQFDISGKVDTNNPIYKFYEKDVQKYLNKFGGKRVVDDKGVSWIEIPITKEQGKMPVEAFGKTTPGFLFGVGGGSALATGGLLAYGKLKKNKDKNR